MAITGVTIQPCQRIKNYQAIDDRELSRHMYNSAATPQFLGELALRLRDQELHGLND